MIQKTPRVDELQVQQGWKDVELLAFALEFINENGLQEDFEKFLEEFAEQENNG